VTRQPQETHTSLRTVEPESARSSLSLGRIIALIKGTSSLPESLGEFLEAMLEAGLQRAELFLIDESRQWLVWCAGRERAGAAISQTAVERDGLRVSIAGPEEILSRAWRTGRTFVLDNPEHPIAAADEPILMHAAVAERMGAGAFAAIPISASGRISGVIVAVDRRGRAALRAGLPQLEDLAVAAGLVLERSEMASRLREEQERYHQFQQFMDQIPDGIAVSTPDGRVISCNDGLLRMLGYTREEMLGRSAGSFYVDPAQREALVRDNAVQGHVEGRTVAVYRKDGGIAHVNVSSRMRTTHGEPQMESIVRDVTESYTLHQRLRLLSDVLTYSADAIISIDTACQVASWNLGAQQILGYTAEEIIGQPYLKLVPGDRHAEFTDVIRRRVEQEGRLLAFETERIHRDGRRIPVSVTVTRMRPADGPDMGWSVVLRDITHRKHEEERRRLLSLITDQLPDAVLSLDRDGRITSWNKGAGRMFGYDTTAIVGRSWLDLAPAERAPEYRQLTTPPSVREQADENGWPRVIDTVALSADGSALPVRLSVSVLRDEKGGATGWSIILRDLTEQRHLAEMSERLHEELCHRNRMEGVVGVSRAMEEVRERALRVAQFSSSVLLVGSSGTGKEIVANAIHYNSPRRHKPFIKVNCAAIPEDLLESELFGIERNVATGVDSRIGRFEMAAGGTLFLDEIGDMSLHTQAKILRALQEKEIERVGGKKVVKVDVRIIAASNKDLDAEIRARRFREDLYYRLNVIVIMLPPLADRREDIDPLIDHFMDKYTREHELPRKRISMAARDLLNAYPWPGNVRELENCMERAIVMSEGTEIVETDLPHGLLLWKSRSDTPEDAGSLSQSIRRVERRVVIDALERSGWVQARAARLLGISERSMWYRVKKLGLTPPAR